MSLLDPHTRWSASFLSMAKTASAEMDLNIKSILYSILSIALTLGLIPCQESVNSTME